MRNPDLETVLTWIADPANEPWPLHARIQGALRQLIIDGALPGLSALPASRSLARSIGVSRDTVEAAYGHLHAEGLITRRIGSGSFVSPTADIASARGTRPRLSVGRPPDLGARGNALMEAGGVMTAPARAFTPGVPETRNFPLATWERLHRQVLKERGSSALRHGDPQGEEPLRRAIADCINLERGGRASPDRIVVLTSSQQAISLCASVLFDAGDEIAIEDPAYLGARRAFVAAGLRCAGVGVDTDGMKVSELAAGCETARGVYVVPSHQYPTGRTLSIDRRLALIEWASTRQAWIIEDDYDGEFDYSGRPKACLQGLDVHGRTIYVGTFTKSVFPALRLAFMVLPAHLVQPMVTARTLLDGFTATIPQLTLARFIESGHHGAYVRAMRTIYARRLETLAGSLRTRMAGLIEAELPSGGLQMPCLLDDPDTERETVEKARRVGVELVGLSTFYSAPSRGRGWLMGFAAYSPSEIKTAVAKLVAAFKTSGHGR